MAGSIAHIYTQTVADGTATSVVRPSDWNSGHAYTLVDGVSLSGNNTAGVMALISSGTLYLAGGNNITLSQNANSVTISAGAYLTTARASTDAIGLNTAQTNVTWTVNSAGLSFNAGGYAGTGFTSTTTAGTDFKATNNTAGLSLAFPAGLTTARASTDAVGLATAQTNVTWTVNSAGISFNAGGYAGTGFTSTTTAGTDMKATNNTAGLSLAFPAALTTAAASNHSHGNPTLALTNLSGTTASASNGFTLSLAADAALGISAAGASASAGTVVFSNSNGVSFGMNGSTVTAKVPSVSQAEIAVPNLGIGALANLPGFFNTVFVNQISATQADFVYHMTGSSAAASGGLTLSIALYTYGGSTANSVSSTTIGVTWTQGSDASAASRWGGQSGTRFRSIALGTWNITPGQYLVGWGFTTGSSQTAQTWSAYGHSIASMAGNAAGGTGNYSQFWGRGFRTAAGAMPASVHLSDFNQTGAAAGFTPYIVFAGTF